MIRQRLADLMAIAIVVAAIAMIFGADIIPDNRDNNIPPIDESGSAKYPIARIELTLEKLLAQMGLSDDPQINKITA